MHDKLRHHGWKNELKPWRKRCWRLCDALLDHIQGKISVTIGFVRIKPRKIICTPKENVAIFVLYQATGQIGAIAEFKAFSQWAAEPHFLVQSPLRSFTGLLARQRVTAASVGP